MTSEQQATLLLWQRVNTSLPAFYKLTKYFKSAYLAMQSTGTKWGELGIHNKHIARHNNAAQAEDDAFIKLIEQRIATNEFNILFKDDTDYPSQLTQLFDPPPLLFYRGNISRLNQAQIAIVGSRKPTISAQKFTFDIAQYLAQFGFVITSGLAQGVDAQAHLGALAQPTELAGRTIGVMGTGIDVCYPMQHKALIDRVVNEGGCVISELLPNTPPNKHTFPRRNRIVAGLALGTVVTEAALKSGSLITARLTSEQGKQVFAMPSSIDNTNAEGCHHLIREGATLIYHPNHVIDEISCQIFSPIMTTQTLLSQPITQNTNIEATQAASIDSLITSDNAVQSLPTAKNQPNKKTTRDNTHSLQQAVSVPEHLQSVWVHIDDEGHDLDALITKTSLDTATLLSQLMELELLSIVTQVGGRYKRL